MPERVQVPERMLRQVRGLAPPRAAAKAEWQLPQKAAVSRASAPGPGWPPRASAQAQARAQRLPPVSVQLPARASVRAQGPEQALPQQVSVRARALPWERGPGQEQASASPPLPSASRVPARVRAWPPQVPLPWRVPRVVRRADQPQDRNAVLPPGLARWLPDRWPAARRTGAREHRRHRAAVPEGLAAGQAFPAHPDRPSHCRCPRPCPYNRAAASAHGPQAACPRGLRLTAA